MYRIIGCHLFASGHRLG